MKAFDWAEFLRLDSLLALQDEKTRNWLVSDESSIEHRYEPGTLIIREGEPGDSIFVIGSGSADVLLSVKGEPEILLAVIRRGETFGEMGFFERRPRSATVRAREACVVLEVKGDALRRLCDVRPEIGFRLLLQVSERLRRNNEKILTLHLKSLEAANRSKDEFVAILGHELRNPLGAITPAIHVLDARGGPDDTAASLRGIILRQVRHLSRLVEDLLDLARELGYRSVYWTLDSGDWRNNATAPLVLNRVLSNVGPGDIVVHHVAATATAEALPAIIEGIQARGLRLVTVSELLGLAPPSAAQ